MFKTKKTFSIALLLSILLFLPTYSNASSTCGSCSGSMEFTPTMNCLSEGMTVFNDAYVGDSACDTDKVVANFTEEAANSDGDGSQYGVTRMASDIEDAGQGYTDILETRQELIVGAYNDLEVNLMDTIGRVVNNINSSFRDFEESNLTQTLNYQSDLESSASKEQRDNIGTGSPEEIRFIINELEEAETQMTRVVIASMKSKYDNIDEFRIPVRFQSENSFTEQSCPRYDPQKNSELQDYSCYKAQKANPGKTLEFYFRECSRQKAKNRTELEKESSEKVLTGEGREPKNIINKQTSGNFSAQTHFKNSLLINCGTQRLANNECSLVDEPETDVSEDANALRREIVSQIIDNKIIFDGDLSAHNLLTPSIIGSVDGSLEVSEQQKESLLKKAGSIESEAVTTSTPELINTYKTSSQYFAARDYSTNIIGKAMMGGVSMGQRRSRSGNQFMTRSFQRESMLNMAMFSFQTSISKRTGTKLTDKIHSGKLERLNDSVQEDINGAAHLDTLRNRIENNYSDIHENNIADGFVESDEDPIRKKYEVELIKARQNLEEYMNWERIEMLLATKLVEQVSSANNINYLRELRNE